MASSGGPKQRVTKKRKAEERADEARGEALERDIARDETARDLGKDAVRTMTEGQDHDFEDPDPLEEIEEVGGPMHISEEPELTDSDSPPDDATREPFPKAHGEGS